MIALTVHILCNIVFIIMTVGCVSIASLAHSDGYGQMDVEHSLKVLVSFFGSTGGIVMQECRFYGASSRLGMGRVNMMVHELASNGLLGVTSFNMIVSVFKMLDRW